MHNQAGKYIMLIGGIIFIIGIIWYFFGNKLHWMGRLPGDIRIEKENFRFYFPITTMIIASLVVTVLVRIIRRFL
ncbi:MAG: DUF2905 domain-containing protein [Chitinophagaceae bacterium]|nr:DUF2905 domain-containing protein [Chitinophagaceae bacterium]